MTKHTPGPWKLIWHGHGHERYPFPLAVHTKDGANWVARDGTCTREADARLIAAAPELLEALKSVVGWIEESEEGEAATQLALYAIAKAEGSK